MKVNQILAVERSPYKCSLFWSKMFGWQSGLLKSKRSIEVYFLDICGLSN